MTVPAEAGGLTPEECPEADVAEFEQEFADTTGKTPLVIKLLVAATFVVILNETIMINAIPRLMDDFAITPRSAQWLSTVFMLTMAAVIPLTGWFLQRVSTRTAYAVAMATFCAGTALAAVAPTFEVLLAGRVIQAAGTAVMMPLLMTTLMTVVPESDRGRVMGQVTLAISCAPALGPAVSGVILELGSWRLIFVFVLPVAASCRHRRDAPAREHRRAPGQLGELAERGAGRQRVLDPGLRPERDRQRLHPDGDLDDRRRRAAGRRVRGLPAAPPAHRQPAARPAHAQAPDLHRLAAADVRRVHGVPRLDDPAAALPAGHPRPVRAPDRSARDARWARDGPARPAGRQDLRPGRLAAAGDPRLDRHGRGARCPEPDRRRHAVLADPRRPRRPDGDASPRSSRRCSRWASATSRRSSTRTAARCSGRCSRSPAPSAPRCWSSSWRTAPSALAASGAGRQRRSWAACSGRSSSVPLIGIVVVVLSLLLPARVEAPEGAPVGH